MKRIVLAAFLANPAVWAQPTTVTPKEIVVAEENRKAVSDAFDQELRERAGKFWDGFVTGKFRASDVYVSDDAKEEYFSWPKKKIRGYKLDRVFYTKEGDVAKVLIFADTNFTMLGYGSMDIQQPVETWWRRENNSWYWFLPKSLIRDTPFGKMELNPQTGEMKPVEGSAPVNRPTWKDLRSKVTVSRKEVSFSRGTAAKQEIEVLNELPGTVTFAVEPPLGTDEIKVEVPSKEIQQAAKAKIYVTYSPKAKPAEPATYVLKVSVAQTGGSFAVKLIVQ